jgi:hypothetical protein
MERLFGGGHHKLRRKGKRSSQSPGSNGSAVVSGKEGGEESGEGRQIRCGAVPEASKDNWGIVALQQAHGGNEGGMQHASGGIDRIW